MKLKSLNSLELGSRFCFSGSDIQCEVVGFIYEDDVRFCLYRPLKPIVNKCKSSTKVYHYV